MIWTNDTPVVLYGAAHAGATIYKKLHKYCNISAFIDRRADEISYYMEIPVFAIDSGAIDSVLKSNAIVVVAVKNIFEHEKITLDLIKHGFNHIVFCPVDGSLFEYRSNDERTLLTNLYNNIISFREFV